MYYTDRGYSRQSEAIYIYTSKSNNFGEKTNMFSFDARSSDVNRFSGQNECLILAYAYFVIKNIGYGLVNLHLKCINYFKLISRVVLVGFFCSCTYYMPYNIHYKVIHSYINTYLYHIRTNSSAIAHIFVGLLLIDR